MDAMPLNGSRSDDPRRLRELIHKASSFASAYDLTSVMVGMSGVEGDLMFPEMVDYVGSALRIDDGIFRLTRERVIFFLADADRQRAEEIMERLLVGFRERHAPYITDMHRCEVLAEPVDSMIDPLSELIGGLSISARLPQVELAVADNAVALVFRVLDPPTDDDAALLSEFGKQHDVRIYLQPRGLDSVTLLYPESVSEPLYYELPEFDIRIAFDAVGFVQVNSEINRRMVSRAIELLNPGPDDRVLDMYCGIGNFSLPLARHAGTVLGVEGDAMLVQAATENAALNGIENASFRQVDLSGIDGSESWLKEGWDQILLDPARSGAQEIVNHVEKYGAKRIVYVSCHPGTLARDAGTLVNEKGYKCEAAGIIDMFPHTAHVESIAVFNK